MREELYLRYKSIAVLSAVAKKISPLAELAVAEGELSRAENAARVFGEVAGCGCDSTGEWIEYLLKRDDNVFSRTAACGGRISPRIKKQVEKELDTFRQLSLLRPEDFITEGNAQFFPSFGYGGMSLTVDKLARFHASHGCGIFATGNTFVYDGEIAPAPSRPVRLSDLKNYAEEKAEIVKNTEDFIKGLPAFNTLLYGDRGTGKSTTVHALAYEYRDRLKVIEIAKSALTDLPKLFNLIDGFSQKFILFVDDLSFDEADERVGSFKAALEGSLTCTNALLYCTTNRRHLINEEEKSVRRNDDVQSRLALFDRFGLVVTYVNPDRDEFIDILKQIINARGMKWRDEYAHVAELAALKKGGRSPRAAKQIADLIEASQAQSESGS